MELTLEQIAAVIDKHQHSYDSDCGEDYGCSCSHYLLNGEKHQFSPDPAAEHIEVEWSPEHVAGAILDSIQK